MQGNADHTEQLPAVESHNGRWFVREVLGTGPYRARYMVIAAHDAADGKPKLDGYWHDLENSFDVWHYAADAALEAAQRAIDFRP